MCIPHLIMVCAISLRRSGNGPWAAPGSSFLVARPVAQVVLTPARIPAPVLGVDEVVTLVLILIEAELSK